MAKVENLNIRYRNLLENHLQNQIDASIKWLCDIETKIFSFTETKYQQDVFESLEDEWDSILSAKYQSIEILLVKIYSMGKSKAYTYMGQHSNFTEADKLALAFARNYNIGLIRNLDNDVRNQIKNKIIVGFLAGEHPNNIAPELSKVIEECLDESAFSPKQKASMFAKIAFDGVQNTGILQSYVNEGYVEVQMIAAEDNKVCDVCNRCAFEFNEYDSVIYNNGRKEKIHNISKLIREDKFLLFSPACRCIYLPIGESKGEPPENPLIVNLIFDRAPIFLNDFHDNSDTFDVLPYEKLTEEKFPGDLPILLKEGSLKFDEKIQNAKWEYMYMANLTTSTLGEIFTNHGSDNVTPKADFEISVGDELIAVHNHRSHMPFNTDDFELIFENQRIYVKYLVVHTPTDIFICELDSVALPNKDIILDELANCYGAPIIERGIEDYITANNVWENFKFNKLLNKYMSFRRIRK